MNVTLPCRGVKEDEILFERQGLCSHMPVGRNRHARAVENQVVVAADLIDIDNWTPLFLGDGAQHLKAQISLVDGIGRGGKIQQDAGSLLAEFHHRVTLIQACGPEIRVIPHVLANRDAKVFILEAVDHLLLGRLKVA